MSRTRPLTRKAGEPNTRFGFLLHKERAEFERYRVEPALKHDARAARFRRAFMLVDHFPHPERFAAEIEIVEPEATRRLAISSLP